MLIPLSSCLMAEGQDGQAQAQQRQALPDSLQGRVPCSPESLTRAPRGHEAQLEVKRGSRLCTDFGVTKPPLPGGGRAVVGRGA